jgi:hypothetical protein
MSAVYEEHRNLLHQLFKDNLIPERHRHRMILGFSTGTLKTASWWSEKRELGAVLLGKPAEKMGLTIPVG